MQKKKIKIKINETLSLDNKTMIKCHVKFMFEFRLNGCDELMYRQLFLCFIFFFLRYPLPKCIHCLYALPYTVYSVNEELHFGQEYVINIITMLCAPLAHPIIYELLKSFVLTVRAFFFLLHIGVFQLLF